MVGKFASWGDAPGWLVLRRAAPNIHAIAFPNHSNTKRGNSKPGATHQKLMQIWEIKCEIDFKGIDYMAGTIELVSDGARGQGADARRRESILR